MEICVFLMTGDDVDGEHVVVNNNIQYDSVILHVNCVSTEYLTMMDRMIRPKLLTLPALALPAQYQVTFEG